MEEVIDLAFDSDSDDDHLLEQADLDVFLGDGPCDHIEDDDLEPEEQHAIFDDVERGDLEAVQQRVLANGAVLDERESSFPRKTPLIHAFYYDKTAIALWLIQHRGQHDVNTADNGGMTALHLASLRGQLGVVQALVAVGANPAACAMCKTPLMWASHWGRTDVVAFLLQLPPVKATINYIHEHGRTAIFLASRNGHQPTVQLLLDAGADPTIPAGDCSPLDRALGHNYHNVAALLRHAIAEAERARALHKARSLLGAGAASLACLQGRMERGQAIPQLELSPEKPNEEEEDMHQQLQPLKLQEEEQQQEMLRATAAFAVGLSGGDKDTGLCDDLYYKLQEYMLPVWADKGPAGV